MTERGPKGIRRWWKRFGEIWPAIVAHERWTNGMRAAGYRAFNANPFMAHYIATGIVKGPSRLDWPTDETSAIEDVS